ncbi:MAG TPA: hypothetical protein VFV67_20920 [Actinophytocola sp.]|uniref:hypothetical protein n=1 Tax=Actinophytocola sp. TaxID=1872138 RepID=UPI002DBF309D|nr:hypothetical protein [Actinophytocola sp.]HEU5473117.1 hypothetical protein [Actinophytocola sp.]
MTDARGPDGPPWSVDVLADLHAGVLDAETSARLWPAVNADPEARAVIEALDTVKVELGQLAGAPPAPMPAHFAARLDAALATEAGRARAPRPADSSAAPVIDLTEARRRRNRRVGLGAAVLTAAAAAVAVTIAIFPSGSTGGSPVPGQAASAPAATPPLPVDTDNISAAIGGIRAQRDYGALKDQSGLDECLRANNIDPTKAETLGVRPIMLDRTKPAIMAMLGTGELGKFRVVIVEPTCSAANPGLLVDTPLPTR